MVLGFDIGLYTTLASTTLKYPRGLDRQHKVQNRFILGDQLVANLSAILKSVRLLQGLWEIGLTGSYKRRACVGAAICAYSGWSYDQPLRPSHNRRYNEYDGAVLRANV